MRPADSAPGWRKRPSVNSPNGYPDDTWLAQTHEDPISPDLDIIDAHHHLWDRSGSRYLIEEFSDDIGFSGRNISASVYVQCRSMLRNSGPTAYRPVGEIEFIRGVAAQARSGSYGPTLVGSGVVGGADLKLGAAVGPVLDEMMAAGGGLLRGIRTPVAWHPDPAISSGPVKCDPGIMETAAFNDGVEQLVARDLSLDLWAYQTQLPEVFRLANAFPKLKLALNHLGGPILAGHADTESDARILSWRHELEKLAVLPNVHIKLGGFGMPVMGFNFRGRATPPSSNDLVRLVGPLVQTCIEIFGPERCMFESNFPVDRVSFGYGTLWNAFEKLTESIAVDKKHVLFHDTAKNFYKL